MIFDEMYESLFICWMEKWTIDALIDDTLFWMDTFIVE